MLDSVLLLKHSLILNEEASFSETSVFTRNNTRLTILIVTALRKSHTNFKLTNVNLGCADYFLSQSMPNNCRYTPHKDVSVND